MPPARVAFLAARIARGAHHRLREAEGAQLFADRAALRIGRRDGRARRRGARDSVSVAAGWPSTPSKLNGGLLRLGLHFASLRDLLDSVHFVDSVHSGTLGLCGLRLRLGLGLAAFARPSGLCVFASLGRLSIRLGLRILGLGLRRLGLGFAALGLGFAAFGFDVPSSPRFGLGLGLFGSALAGFFFFAAVFAVAGAGRALALLARLGGRSGEGASSAMSRPRTRRHSSSTSGPMPSRVAALISFSFLPSLAKRCVSFWWASRTSGSRIGRHDDLGPRRELRAEARELFAQRLCSRRPGRDPRHGRA